MMQWSFGQLDQIKRLKNRIPQHAPSPEQRPFSAVLIALDACKVGDPCVVLTKRAETVDSHKGQIALPGGFFEDKDGTTLNTALREFEEEVGGVRKQIEILGCLSPVFTHTRIPIFPWVGVVNLPVDYVANPAEVVRILFLPLQRLLIEGLMPVSVSVSSGRVSSVGIEVDGELVWGATARILEQLRQELLNLSKETA